MGRSHCQDRSGAHSLTSYTSYTLYGISQEIKLWLPTENLMRHRDEAVTGPVGEDPRDRLTRCRRSCEKARGCRASCHMNSC